MLELLRSTVCLGSLLLELSRIMPDAATHGRGDDVVAEELQFDVGVPM